MARSGRSAPTATPRTAATPTGHLVVMRERQGKCQQVAAGLLRCQNCNSSTVAAARSASPLTCMYGVVPAAWTPEMQVVRIRGRGDHEQAVGLERWLREVELGFADRILPVTLPVASAWGRQQHSQPLPVVDGLIAATAKVNGLTVVTRNARDFERSGVQVLNPFRGLIMAK